MARVRSLTAVALSLLLGATSLAGCSGGGKKAPTEPAPAAASAPASSSKPASTQPPAKDALAGGTAHAWPGTLEGSTLTATDPATNYVDVVGKRVRVTKVGTRESLTPAQANDVYGTPKTWPDKVGPAEGHQIVVAEVTIEKSPFTDPISDYSFAGMGSGLIVDGMQQGDFLDDVEIGQTMTMVAITKKDAPKVLLAIEQSTATQGFDLVKGTRLSTDLDYLYTAPTTATPDPAKNHWKFGFKGSRNPNATMEGTLTTAVVTLSRDGNEWPKKGIILLGVDIKEVKLSSLDTDKSTISVSLPDGTSVKPIKDVPGFGERFPKRLYFEIPSTTKQATVVIDHQVVPGAGAPVPVGTSQIPITLSRP